MSFSANEASAWRGARPTAKWGGTHTRSSIRRTNTVITQDGTINLASDSPSTSKKGPDHTDHSAAMREFTAAALATQSAAVLRIISQLSDRQVKSISAMAELKSLAIKINYHCIRHRDTIAAASAAAAMAEGVTDASLSEQLAAAGAAVGGGQGLQRLSQAGKLLISLDSSGGAAVSRAAGTSDTSTNSSTPKLVEQATDIRSSAVSLFASLKDCCNVIEAAGGLWVFANTRMGRDVRFMQSELSSGLATLLSSLAHAPSDGRWPTFSAAPSIGWPGGWVDASGVAILNASVVFPWVASRAATEHTATADDAFSAKTGHGMDIAWLVQLWRRGASHGDAVALLRLAALSAQPTPRLLDSLGHKGRWENIPTEQQVASWRYISSSLCLGPVQPLVLGAAAQFLLQSILPCTLQQLQGVDLGIQRNQVPALKLLKLQGVAGTPERLPSSVLDALFEFAQDCTPHLAMFLKAAHAKQEQAQDDDKDEWADFWGVILSAAVLSVRGVIAHCNEQRGSGSSQPPLSSAAAWHVFADWAGCSVEWQSFLQRAFETNLLSSGTAVTNGYVTADANIWGGSKAEVTPSFSRAGLGTHARRDLGTSGMALLSAFRQGGVSGGIRGAVGGTAAASSHASFSLQSNTRNAPIPSGSQFIGGDFEASEPLAQVAAYTNGQLLGDRKLLGSVACETFPAIDEFAPAAKDLLFLQNVAAQGEGAEAVAAGIRSLGQEQAGLSAANGERDASAASMQRLLGIAQSSTSRVLQSRLEALRGAAAGDAAQASGAALRRLQAQARGAASQTTHSDARTSVSDDAAGSVVSSRLAGGRLSSAAGGEAMGADTPPSQGGSALNKRITAVSAENGSAATLPQRNNPSVQGGPPGGAAAEAGAGDTPAPQGATDGAEAAVPHGGQRRDSEADFHKDALQRVLNSVDVAAEAELSVHSPHASPEEDEAADRAYSPFDVRSAHPAPQQLARKDRHNSVSPLDRFVFERLVAEAQERGLLLDESTAYVDSKANLSVADLEVISDLEHFVHPRASVVGLLETWYGYNLAGSVTHMWGGAASGLGSVVERVQAGREYALKLYMPPDDAADTISEAAHALAREVAAGAMPEQVLAGEGAVGCMQPFSYKLSGPATMIGMSIRQNLRGFSVSGMGPLQDAMQEPQLVPCEFVGPALQNEYIRASAACLIDLAASLYDPPQFEDVRGAAAPASGRAFRLVTSAKARAQHRDLRAIGAVMQVHLARAMLTASALAGGSGESACTLGNLLDSGVLRPGSASEAHVYGSWILRREPQLAAVWYAIGAALGSSSAANSLGHMFVSGKLHQRLPALLMNCVHRMREAFGADSSASDTQGGSPRQLPKGVFASLIVVIARTQMQSEGGEGARMPLRPQACCSPTQTLLPQDRVQEAAFWFGMAAEQHHAAGSNNIAVCEELLSPPSSVYGQPTYSTQYLTAARLGSISGNFNLAYTLAKHARSAHELSEATAQMQRLAAAGDMRAKFHLACLLEGSFRKLQRIPQLSNTVLAPSLKLQEGAVWPTLQSLSSSASTDAVSVQMYMQAAAFGNADAALKCGHICYAGIAAHPRSFEKAIMYYLAAALGGNAAGLNALACMVEEGKGFKGGACTVRAEVLFRLAAGDAAGASILLWEVQQSEPDVHAQAVHTPGGEQLLPHLPTACLAALPVPADTCVEAQMNLYWLYQSRAKSLLVQVYCSQQQQQQGGATLSAGARGELQHRSSTAAGMHALMETIRTRLVDSSAQMQPGGGGLHEALLLEAGFYRQEAAAWLAAAARGGSQHARRIQGQMQAAASRW